MKQERHIRLGQIAALVLSGLSCLAVAGRGVSDSELIRRLAEADCAGRQGVAEALIDSLAADHTGLLRVCDMAEAMLYDPESEDADEDLYRLWIRTVMDRGGLSEAEMIRPASQLEEMAKNAVGTRAADVEVELPDGSETGLLSLLSGEGNTLVVFYDPECDHCDEVIEALRGGAIDDRAGTIVAVCVEGERETWLEKIATLPAQWHHAYGTPLLGMDAEEEIYVLREMPTLYLLDSDGRVAKKNVKVK